MLEGNPLVLHAAAQLPNQQSDGGDDHQCNAAWFRNGCHSKPHGVGPIPPAVAARWPETRSRIAKRTAPIAETTIKVRIGPLLHVAALIERLVVRGRLGKCADWREQLYWITKAVAVEVHVIGAGRGKYVTRDTVALRRISPVPSVDASTLVVRCLIPFVITGNEILGVRIARDVQYRLVSPIDGVKGILRRFPSCPALPVRLVARFVTNYKSCAAAAQEMLFTGRFS